MTGLTSREFTDLRRAVMKWSAAHQRELPWRNIGDPYRVWVSEVMLQQTTVAAVIPYYERFLARFPDVHALAAADESEVLRLWEGLGYYSRARNLHRGAQAVMALHAGRFPREAAALIALPGIGRYTAGAIASFAFNQRAPIVEANTLRLHARLLGFSGDPRSAAGQTALWKFAEDILPRADAGPFNQALMDLGATVCTPKSPNCPECPLKRWCQAFREGTVAEIPALAPRPETTPLWSYSVAIRRHGRYLLRKYRTGERWAGLWDFPRWERATPLPALQTAGELSHWVREFTGLPIELGPQFAEFSHGVTRYRITAACFAATTVHDQVAAGEWAWVTPEQFAQFAFSVTGRKFANRLNTSLFGRHFSP